MKESVLKPFLKWAGGKRQLLPILEKSLPQNYTNYFEPFIGAGALFLHLAPENALINDYNEQLIMTYNAVKTDVDNLINLLNQYKESNSKEFYYNIRALDRLESFAEMSEIEKAARFIYMNKTCFNGLYRVNSKGFNNVPYANNKNPGILDEKLLHSISEYLNNNNITILNGDFADAVKGAEKGDFVYFDPPYHSENNANFTSYQEKGFDESEQERLKQLVDRLTAKGVQVLLSNSDTTFIRELYSSDIYEVNTVQAKRQINSNHKKRGYINEVLINNYKSI